MSLDSTQKMVGPRQGLHYGWLVLAAAFIVSACGSAVVYSFGVFFKPLQAELGWSRAFISGVFSAFMLCRGFSGMGIGWLADRIGTRLVVVAGAILTAAGLLLTASATSLWQLYVFYGLLVGVGASVPFILPFAVITRWFEQRRGLVLGLVAGGIGLGSLVSPPVTQQLIHAFGWRWAYVIWAVVVCVLLATSAIFMRRTPKEMGLSSFGGSSAAARAGSATAESAKLSLKQVLGNRQVQIMSVAYFMLTLSGQTVWVHIVNHATDRGVDPLVAATFVSVSGGVSIIGRLVLGASSDKTGAKLALLIAQSILVCALIFLVFASRTWMFYLFAAAFGFAYGGTVPQQPALLGRIFGLRSMGLLLGVTGIPISLGAATGPYIAGLIFDVTGSYRMAFGLAAVLTFVALLVVLSLKVPARQPAAHPALVIGGPTH